MIKSKPSPPDLASLTDRLPALFLVDPKSSEPFWEFFAANIRNGNTRRASYKGACRFSEWCEGRGLFDLAGVKPIHVAPFVEELRRSHSKPTVKQHLAALRMLFGWPVVGHVIEVNPAQSVQGPKHVVKKGKTPVRTAEEARALLNSIDPSSVVGGRAAARSKSTTRFREQEPGGGARRNPARTQAAAIVFWKT